MKITHEFTKCIACETVIEVVDEDRQYGNIACPNCGYLMEFDNLRFESWTEEY